MDGGERCAFCGQPTLVAEEEGDVTPPESIAPFEVDRAAAGALLQKALASAVLAPSDLARDARLSELRPVFVPYWDLSAEFTALWTVDAPRVQQRPAPATAMFGSSLVESRDDEGSPLEKWLQEGGYWHPVQGEFEGRCEHVVVPGSSALTEEETNALGSIDLQKAVPFDGDRLGGVPVEDVSISRRRARRAATPLLERAAWELWPRPPGFTQVRNLNVNPLFRRTRARAVLFPVWIVIYSYRGRRYRNLINGVTGVAHWERPDSPWKLAGCALVALAVLAAAIAVVMLVFDL